MAKRKRENYPYQLDRLSGQAYVEKVPQDLIDSAVSLGILCEVRTRDKVFYFANNYIHPNVLFNLTIGTIFDGTEYCRKSVGASRCAKYIDFGDTHEDCNTCIWRMAVTHKEQKRPKFINEKDNYVAIEPPEEEDFAEESPKRLITYNQYLQTPYWKEFRQKVLEHYNYMCNWCGKAGVSLNIHHIRYGEWFNEEIENVVPLCAACHQKAHGRG